MSKLGNMLALALFVLGFLAAPALHRLAAHGDAACAHEAPTPAPTHGDDHCGLCRLAHAPILGSAPQAPSVTLDLLAPALPVATRALPIAPAYRLPYACGPPA